MSELYTHNGYPVDLDPLRDNNHKHTPLPRNTLYPKPSPALGRVEGCTSMSNLLAQFLKDNVGTETASSSTDPWTHFERLKDPACELIPMFSFVLKDNVFEVLKLRHNCEQIDSRN